MAHNVEPMDVDCIDSEFDNKENTFHHSNLLPCTEKGYEELDVSELNMKLRYSITPAASPMSKSYTSYTDNRSLDFDDSLNCTVENNLTRSLNSTITKNDRGNNSLKTLPLQSLPTEFGIQRPLDTTLTNTNVTVTLSEANENDENLSLPSTSSSLTHTPEATTPVNDVKNDSASPIMRGLKTVLNMFRPSQSPIPTTEGENTKPELNSLDSTITEEKLPVLASTPIAAHRSKDGNSSRRSSPLKESITFKDDLEKELQWKDETTIFFSEDKIPIHKLFFQNTKSVTENVPERNTAKPVENSIIEYMDISHNDTIINDRTLSEIQADLDTDKNEFHATTESDGEFVDCETTFTNESQVQDAKEIIPEIKDPLLDTAASEIGSIHNITEKPDDNVAFVDISSIEPSKDNANPLQEVREDTNSTISIIQELDSLLEGNNSQKNVSSNENPIDSTVSDKINEKVDQKEVIPDAAESPNTNSKIDNIQSEETKLEPYLAMESVKTQSILPIEQQALLESHDNEEITLIHEANASDKNNEKVDQKEVIPDAAGPLNTNSEIDNVQSEETKLEPNLTIESVNTQSILTIEQQAVLESQEPEETTLIHEAKPADVPLPDEDDIEKELKLTDVLETVTLLQTNSSEVVEMVQADITQINYETVDKNDTTQPQENIPLPEESVLITDVKINNDVLNTADQTVLEVYKEVEKSEIETLEIESQLPDLVNQTITNEQQNIEALQTKQFEDTQQIINEIKVIPLSNEPEHTPHLENSPIKQMTLKPTVPSIEQNDSVLIHCDVNSTITIENKIDDGLKDTTVCIPESIDEIVITQENASLNIDNTNHTVNKEINVTMVDECDNDVLQNNFTITIEDKVTKEESTTENNADSTVLIDNKSDLDTTLENNGTTIDTKKANSTVVVESKLDDTQQTFKDNMPPTDNDTTLENNNDTTAVIDVRKDVEFNKIANATVAVQSKLDDTQEHFMDNIPPTDTIVRNEPVNKPEISDTCESPNTDGEINVSENNSPYVSVMAGIDTEPKATEDNFETTENTFTSTVPSSPPIVSKGYNFNFDEIDNPFATKTKIRLSPPPVTPSKNTELENTPYTEFERPKKAPINRRKSQPPERKKTAMNKKKFNTTINAKLPNDKLETEKEILEPTMDLKPALQNDTLNDLDLKPDVNLDKVTEIEFQSSDSKDINNSATNESETCETHDHSLKLEDGNEKKLEQKSSCESSVTNISEVKTSSSEQSTYFSTAASSTESLKSKNVFNLPEIDDVNFNPFATKSKMRQSPPPLDLEENPFVIKPKIKVPPDSSMNLMNYENTINKVGMNVEDKMDIEQMEKEVDISNATSSSKTVDGRNLTHEINTEDEDTEEGPFLEAEDALDKASISGDCEFNRLPMQNEDNLEAGEMFIDAETFEFLLNQNKTNMVADSGKESLFLKFDPLFAKKISSDGVVAALSKVQKRHSTPTRARPSLQNDTSPIAGPSNINVTYEANLNASAEESNEDINITVSKPTMVVTPAVNPAITPRTKAITPNRSNRRSITFTSPAMAVIDRLLSMSANNSLVDTTVTQSQNEADLALAQLRELLAEKEIDVYNLKAESMELKERLNSMESQVKLLEADGEERLKNINELNSQLAEKSKINRSMAAVVEEYERTIASLIAETEQDKKRHAEERMRLINERDEQTAHLASMEVSFSDLHSKYEKSKQVILNFKANEEAYEKSIKDFEESMTKMQNNYEMLKQHATSKLNHANSELEKINKAHEAEVLKLNALLKRNALHITSLEETLAQKTKANDELTAICDELINKVG